MILSGALEVETEENEQGREDRADGSIGRLVHADFQLHEGDTGEYDMHLVGIRIEARNIIKCYEIEHEDSDVI